MLTKKSIVRAFNQHSTKHRSDFIHCPVCDSKFDTDEWDSCATRLMLDIVDGKHGSVVVESECPKCFSSSWVHQPFSSFSSYSDSFSDEWKTAAIDERYRRHLKAVHEFADSLCAKCAYLCKLECDTLPIVRCTMGDSHKKAYMQTCLTKKECGKFQIRKVAK